MRSLMPMAATWFLSSLLPSMHRWRRSSDQGCAWPIQIAHLVPWFGSEMTRTRTIPHWGGKQPRKQAPIRCRCPCRFQTLISIQIGKIRPPLRLKIFIDWYWSYHMCIFYNKWLTRCRAPFEQTKKPTLNLLIARAIEHPASSNVSLP